MPRQPSHPITVTGEFSVRSLPEDRSPSRRVLLLDGVFAERLLIPVSSLVRTKVAHITALRSTIEWAAFLLNTQFYGTRRLS